MTVSSKYSEIMFSRPLKDNSNEANSSSNIRNILKEIRNRTSPTNEVVATQYIEKAPVVNLAVRNIKRS